MVSCRLCFKSIHWIQRSFQNKGFKKLNLNGRDDSPTNMWIVMDSHREGYHKRGINSLYVPSIEICASEARKRSILIHSLRGFATCWARRDVEGDWDNWCHCATDSSKTPHRSRAPGNHRAQKRQADVDDFIKRPMINIWFPEVSTGWGVFLTGFWPLNGLSGSWL